MTVQDLENDPKLQVDCDDISAQAAVVATRHESVMIGEKLPDNDHLYERASDSAELMVLMLMRYYRSESMMALVTDELSRAIKAGW